MSFLLVIIHFYYIFNILLILMNLSPQLIFLSYSLSYLLFFKMYYLTNFLIFIGVIQSLIHFYSINNNWWPFSSNSFTLFMRSYRIFILKFLQKTIINIFLYLFSYPLVFLLQISDWFLRIIWSLVS